MSDSADIINASIQQRDSRTGILLGRSAPAAQMLPPYGTWARLNALRQFYREDGNVLLRGAFAGIAKRIASLPWIIRGSDAGLMAHYQDVFQQANFGEGWTVLLTQVALDFLRYDNGAFIELIGEGDPNSPITSELLGIASLDPLRCLPTGDPIYPVLYWDASGSAHQMHYTRVLRVYDSPETDDYYRGWGDSALSRALTIGRRQVLMQRYVEQRLDSNPPPGIFVATNLNRAQVDEAMAAFELRQDTDGGSLTGRNIWLYSMAGENEAKITSVPFSEPPQSFDFRTYTDLDIDYLALAIGVDVQEIWRLTGNALGSGMQSEILNLKSRGKTIGYLISSVERLFNLLLPEELTFAFEYRDESETLQNAQTAAAWASAVGTMGLNLNTMEARAVLAQNVPSVRDAITDADGSIQGVTDLITEIDNDEMSTGDTRA